MKRKTLEEYIGSFVNDYTDGCCDEKGMIELVKRAIELYEKEYLVFVNVE